MHVIDTKPGNLANLLANLDQVLVECCPAGFMEENKWTAYARHFAVKDRETKNWKWRVSDGAEKEECQKQILQIANSKILSLGQKIGILCWQFSNVLIEVPVIGSGIE
jgi:hypothetical protein